MTNKDKIKRLETWDLAEFLLKVSNREIEITTCEEECKGCEYSEGWCTFQVAEWLNKEAEGL